MDTVELDMFLYKIGIAGNNDDGSIDYSYVIAHDFGSIEKWVEEKGP